MFNTQKQNFREVKTLLKAMYRLICYKKQCSVNRKLCVVYNEQFIKFGLGAFRRPVSFSVFLSFYYIDNGASMCEKTSNIKSRLDAKYSLKIFPKACYGENVSKIGCNVAKGVLAQIKLLASFNGNDFLRPKTS